LIRVWVASITELPGALVAKKISPLDPKKPFFDIVDAGRSHDVLRGLAALTGIDFAAVCLPIL
jgi:hypothetical protein